jgi:hypothetical protein
MEEKTMTHKWIKGPIWLLMLMVIFCGLQANMASANSGGKSQSLPVKNDLLQFKAGSHVMGFKPDKAYLVNTAGFLSVEFLGAHTIVPQAVAADNTNRHQDDIALTPDREDTLANLQRVEYQDLWDGITLRYEAVQTGIAESTYFIQPGADVTDIRLRYNADTELQEDGSLKIKLATRQGYITESTPVAWQMVDGRKKAVEVAYELHNGTIGFKTGAYNKDQELIIDPTYQWHTFYGSAAEDEGNSIAIDGSGNVYVTGYSETSWGSPVHDHSTGSNMDIMVLKLDNSGALQWNTFYGSGNTDEGKGIAVDGIGNVYVTGHSNTSWGSPVAPLHAHTSGFDVVVLKLDSSGAYQWHTFYGSASTDYGLGIAVNGSDIYVTGISVATWGSPVNPHGGGGNADIVIFRLDHSGTTLQWNTFHGSTSTDYAYGIAVDGNGNTYITGYSNASWGTPLHDHSGGGKADIVILKLNGSGVYQWHTFYGSGTYDDYGKGIAVDGSGNTYVTGTSQDTWGNPVHSFSGSGSGDITILKLNSSGALQWHTFHGSTSIDYGYGIAIDGSGKIYVTGYSQATWGSPLHAYSGSADITALKLNNSGILQGNTFYGAASLVDHGYAIAVDGNENVYITGYSETTWGAPLHAYSGDHDIVVLKISTTFKKFPWPMFIPAITKGGIQ